MREVLAVVLLAAGYIAATDAQSPADPPPKAPDGRALVWLVDRAAWVPVHQAPRMTEYHQTPPHEPAIADGARVLDRLMAEKVRPSVPCYVHPHPGLIGTGHVTRIICD